MLSITKKHKLKSITSKEAYKINRIERSDDILNIGPLIKGKGKTDCLCDNCGFTILNKVDTQKFKNQAFLCPSCKVYNSI